MFPNFIIRTGMNTGDSSKPGKLGQPLCTQGELEHMWLTEQVHYDV